MVTSTLDTMSNFYRMSQWYLNDDLLDFILDCVLFYKSASSAKFKQLPEGKVMHTILVTIKRRCMDVTSCAQHRHGMPYDIMTENSG